MWRWEAVVCSFLLLLSKLPTTSLILHWTPHAPTSLSVSRSLFLSPYLLSRRFNHYLIVKPTDCLAPVRDVTVCLCYAHKCVNMCDCFEAYKYALLNGISAKRCDVLPILVCVFIWFGFLYMWTGGGLISCAHVCGYPCEWVCLFVVAVVAFIFCIISLALSCLPGILEMYVNVGGSNMRPFVCYCIGLRLYEPIW